MNYLLDTHTFIWWDSKPEKLSTQVLKYCEDGNNKLFLSIASIWEMQIKHQLGKLSFDTDLELLIKEQVQNNSLLLLAIKPKHVFTLSKLPNVHKDPFDRLLISQSMQEEMTLLSCDSVFSDYPVDVIW